MEKIPTVDEFLERFEVSDREGNANYYEIKQFAIKFANLHIQEALKTALEEIPYGGSDEIRYEDVVHILDCYPLENIK